MVTASLKNLQQFNREMAPTNPHSNQSEDAMARILLIDDDDAMRTLVATRLGREYEVVATADPTEAISLALELQPHCILLDLLMPDLTGFELCKTLSSLSLTRDTPILIFSGNPAMDYQEFCAHLGARDYFQKPLDFDRLQNRIDELVAGHCQESRREASVKLKVGIELRGLPENLFDSA